MSNYLVVYVRLLTSGQLQQDSDEYYPFVEGLYKDMKEFCDKVGALTFYLHRILLFLCFLAFVVCFLTYRVKAS